MHFEILVEDQSGKKALDILVPKIIGHDHTFIVRSYKGIGHIPKNMKDSHDASKRILLNNLPKILKGYGKTFAGYSAGYRAAVVLVCDLDDRCLKKFRLDLLGILDACNPRPETRFCIAIEEGEAWFLGDLSALKMAYPNAKDNVLATYVNDSICCTWEKLADALYPGGSTKLSEHGWQTVGKIKGEWAQRITPHMDPDNNNSPSFCYFRKKLRELASE
ncbi:MAG: DUF4276 family protein [Proteobacteria bacterium]|nr:DUF4276 family protein [Pseudomonadota bacterium]MBU0968883.1 DUF4276 family protein [Pseudomonadota bacterium]